MVITSKKKGIFYNGKKAVCSIYESGVMVYNCLKDSNNYDLFYSEKEEFDLNYDFAIVNQHNITNNWIKEIHIKIFNKPIFCVVTEVGLKENNLLEHPPKFFTAYILLDSSVKDKNNIYGFPRPLENYKFENEKINPIPIVGSFGFATPGKRWDKIIIETQKSFDEAIIRFNIPYATYVPGNEEKIKAVKDMCNGIITKPKIKLEITHNTLSKEELLNWCRENTINCFLYEREEFFNCGLCATTDQAIIAERPLLVSYDKTFRHIHKYINYYPNISIKEAIEQTKNGVKKMKEDWSSVNFLNKFENILEYYLKKNEKNKNIEYEILSANYYFEESNKNGIVTELIKKLFKRYLDCDYLIKINDIIINNDIFFDSCPGQHKKLYISIKVKKNGLILKFVFNENDLLDFNVITEEIKYSLI
jgi:hypothetical protein